MDWLDKLEDQPIENFWTPDRASDDLLLGDAIRILQALSGQKVSRIERRTKRRGHKSEHVPGPHAEVDHETKDAVKKALSKDDFKKVGSDNPDIYIKSKGNGDDDDLIVLTRPATHANTIGKSKKHITNIHARDVLGPDYRDKVNVLKLTTSIEPIVFVFTLFIMVNGQVYVLVQRQVDDSILSD